MHVLLSGNLSISFRVTEQLILMVMPIANIYIPGHRSAINDYTLAMHLPDITQNTLGGDGPDNISDCDTELVENPIFDAAMDQKHNQNNQVVLQTEQEGVALPGKCRSAFYSITLEFLLSLLK